MGFCLSLRQDGFQDLRYLLGIPVDWDGSVFGTEEVSGLVPLTNYYYNDYEGLTEYVTKVP